MQESFEGKTSYRPFIIILIVILVIITVVYFITRPDSNQNTTDYPLVNKSNNSQQNNDSSSTPIVFTGEVISNSPTSIFLEVTDQENGNKLKKEFLLNSVTKFQYLNIKAPSESENPELITISREEVLATDTVSIVAVQNADSRLTAQNIRVLYSLSKPN